MNRKPVSKGLRFRVFERDSFTCQYCGRKPPEVVLELDHIHPCCEGGDNSEANLVSSCADCNRGKAGRVLNRVFTPDADMEYLRSEQVRMEHERYLDSKLKLEQVTAAVIEQLQKHWWSITNLDSVPADHVVENWLQRFKPETIERGLSAAAQAYHRGAFGSKYNSRLMDAAVRYAGATMYRMEAEDAQSA